MEKDLSLNVASKTQITLQKLNLNNLKQMLIVNATPYCSSYLVKSDGDTPDTDTNDSIAYA